MNIKVKTIQAPKIQLFRLWLEFLKPYHKLRPKEIEALSIMLYYRHQLSMDIGKEDLIDQLLFSKETRIAMREDLGGMSNVIFHNLLSQLRKKNVLTKENIIIDTLVPPLAPNGDNFQLVFNFELHEDK